MAKRSAGLNDYKRVAKEQTRAGKNTQPRYMDGELYRCGDEVLEGSVSYVRPALAHEDSSRDLWRLVVVPRDGGVAIAVPPSTTRAVSNRKDSHE